MTNKESDILIIYLEKTLIKSEPKIKLIEFVGYAGRIPIFNVLFDKKKFPQYNNDEDFWEVVTDLERIIYYKIKSSIIKFFPKTSGSTDLYINFEIH